MKLLDLSSIDSLMDLVVYLLTMHLQNWVSQNLVLQKEEVAVIVYYF